MKSISSFILSLLFVVLTITPTHKIYSDNLNYHGSHSGVVFADGDDGGSGSGSGGGSGPEK